MPRSESRSARKRLKRAWVNRIKRALGCAKCPNIFQLEWHHIDPDTKVEGISRMISNDRSKSAILAELKKCEVLCKPCHDLVHERSEHDTS